jgi:hypothetical protein
MGGQTLIIWSLVVMAEGASGGQHSPVKLDTPLQFGETLYLETANGGRVRGKLVDFDGDRIRVDGHSFSLSQGEIRRIEARVDDSVANGGLIGAGVGAGAALLLCAAMGGDCEEFLVFLGPVYAGAGAGFGVLADALHRGRRLVYVAPPSGFERKLTVSPIWTPDRLGVAVSFSF